jgi:hypothetical protein
MSTARGRSSLIPFRVSPCRATLRAGESLGVSNPTAREPLRAGEPAHLRSQRTPGSYLARGTPPSSPRGKNGNTGPYEPSGLEGSNGLEPSKPLS